MPKGRSGPQGVEKRARLGLRGTLVVVSSLGVCLLHCSSDKSGNDSNSVSSGGSVGSDNTTGGNGGNAGDAHPSTTNGGSDDGGRGGTGQTGGGSGGTNAAGGSNAAATNATGTGGSNTAGAAGLGGEAGAPPELPGGPVLENLVIEGARYPLMPDFTPGRARFSVLPADPVAELQVTAVAGPGLDITIDGTPATSGETVSLEDVEPRSEFDVTVQDASGAQRTYTVLYLPPDFPQFRVTAFEPGVTDDPLYLSPDRGVGYVVQLDNAGVPLFYRKVVGPQDFKRHSNGLRSYSTVKSPTASHHVLDENFNEIDLVEAVGYNTDQHDFHILPNGNYVLIGKEAVNLDLTPYGGPVDGRVINQIFQELTPDREVEFEWNTWGNVVYQDRVAGSQTDYAHANGIVIDPAGDWLLSFRHMAQIIKVDRTTGDVIWRLGGVSSDFDFVDDPMGGLCGQHHPSLLENGNLLVFDNGAPCPPHVAKRPGYTRIVEYELDEVAMKAKLVYSYHQEGPASTTQGSAQRQPNGNTLIGWGGINIPRMATEVDPDGNIRLRIGSDFSRSRAPC